MIAEMILKHQQKYDIGAHSIFIGQVRADSDNESTVRAIIYSSYDDMADNELSKIKENAIQKYDLRCVHIYHSLGEIKTGDISLFVMVSVGHRNNCFESLKYIVEEIKKKVPIWKKELFENGSFRWVE